VTVTLKYEKHLLYHVKYNLFEWLQWRDKTKVEVVMEYYTKYNNVIQSLRKSDLMPAIDTN